MSIVKGNFYGTIKGPITDETPAYEWDSTTTPSTTYYRYELTTGNQFVERLSATKREASIGKWANRTTLTYRPINGG